MFWPAVFGGLAKLGEIEVWVILLGYGAVMLAFLGLVAKLSGGEDDAPGGRQLAGCVTYAVGGTLLQGVLLAIIVAYLYPILLGEERAASLSSLNWGPILGGGLLVAVGGVVATFIPVLGRLITGVPGVLAFLQALVLFRLNSHWIIDEPIARSGATVVDVYPGVVTSIGFVFVALVVVFVMLAGVTLVGRLVQINEELTAGVVAPALGAVAGLIPLFMYADYVRRGVEQALGG